MGSDWRREVRIRALQSAAGHLSADSSSAESPYESMENEADWEKHDDLWRQELHRIAGQLARRANRMRATPTGEGGGA